MKLFDTHTHLQFKAFEGKVDEVIKSAKDAGVEKMIVVGTNLETSKKTIALAEKHDGLYATVGIHPHHVFSYCHPARDAGSRQSYDQAISKLESLIGNPKVIAIGETGLDRHLYEKTQYKNYQITEEFIDLQKQFFAYQIQLAIKHQKSLIIHNREAVKELLEILKDNWDPFLEQRSVFHCVEPDERILEFASNHKIFIGIDGDITYDKAKQDFIKKVPLELLVLETDSPYFTPEPLLDSNSEENAINQPKNLKLIADFISQLKQTSPKTLVETTSQNAMRLFFFN